MRRKNLNHQFILVVASSVCLFFSGCANDPNKELTLPSAAFDDASSVTATVISIDYDARRAILEMPDGKIVPVTVSEDAYNFDQVKAGDLVDITYTASIAFWLEKDSGALPEASRSDALIRAPKGQKPEGVAYKTIDVRAKVVGINYETRTVDLLGPNGRIFPVVADPRITHFENIKKGDEIVATYTEAVAISVRPAKNTTK
jgi:hypothetical protein